MTEAQYVEIENACDLLMGFQLQLVELGWRTNIGADKDISFLRDCSKYAKEIFEDPKHGRKGEYRYKAIVNKGIGPNCQNEEIVIYGDDIHEAAGEAVELAKAMIGWVCSIEQDD